MTTGKGKPERILAAPTLLAGVLIKFNSTVAAVLPECGILSAFGLVCTAIAIPLFHRGS